MIIYLIIKVESLLRVTVIVFCILATVGKVVQIKIKAIYCAIINKYSCYMYGERHV